MTPSPADPRALTIRYLSRADVEAAGVTIGVERAGTSTMTRWTLHGQYGTFDTGRASTSGMGVTLGLSIAGRREVQ